MNRRRGFTTCLAAILVLPSLVRAQALSNDRVVELSLVHTQRSAHRQVLVAESGNHRCMSFGRRGLLQSCVNMKDTRLAFAYTRAVLMAMSVQPKPSRVLVLGAGGGVIPRALRAMDPLIHIDTVEVDEAVVSVAKSHFGFEADARSTIHVGDARRFVRVKQRERQAFHKRQSGFATDPIAYDIIVLDCFDRDQVPEHLVTQEFYRQIASILAPGGVFMVNTIANDDFARAERATHLSVFDQPGQVREFRLDGNRVLMAGQTTLPPMHVLLEQIQPASAWLNGLGVEPLALLQSSWVLEPIQGGPKPMTDRHSPANLWLN